MPERSDVERAGRQALCAVVYAGNHRATLHGYRGRHHPHWRIARVTPEGGGWR